MILNTGLEDQSLAADGNSTLSNNDTNTSVCSENFYLADGGLCRAECGKFEYWPHHVEVIFNILFTVSIILGIIGGIVVTTVSFIRRKQL